jgi:hypothetical protein
MKYLVCLLGFIVTFCGFYHCYSLPNNFPSDTEMESQIVKMKQIYETHMVPFTKAYQELKTNGKTQYKHGDLKKLFDQLPRCTLQKQRSGHLNYRLDDFPLHFGLGRVNGNIDTGAFKGLYEDLQPFMNFLCNEVFYKTPRPSSEVKILKQQKRHNEIVRSYELRSLQEQIQYYKRYAEAPNLFQEKMNNYRNLLSERP